MKTWLWIALAGFLFLTSCSFFRAAAVEEPPPEFEYPGPDSAVEAILNNYRAKYIQETGRVIATAHDTLKFEKPDGGLNNLVSDALRFRAAAESQRFVHIGVIGDGSFRLFFEPGNITIGDMLEFMPYDNHLVILKLKGSQVADLVQQVAGLGGAPISGVRFMLDEQNQAKGILVNAEVIDPEKEYLVATSSWAADGGDAFPALWAPLERYDHNVGLKELFIDHFRRENDLYNITDFRIRS